jgi:glutaryl-CoA dehydrogenase
MYPIWKYGSEEQKQKFYPSHSGEFLDVWLQKPDSGSDPGKYDYRFKDAGDHVILNGAKMWISTAHFVMSVVWAKDENNRITSYVTVWYGRFTTPETHNKWSSMS